MATRRTVAEAPEIEAASETTDQFSAASVPTVAPAPRTAAAAKSLREFDPSKYGLREDVERHAGGDEVDQFNVPKGLIPKGWDVQWINVTIMGAPERPEVTIKHLDNGWQYAPPELFMPMLPPGYNEKTILRGGQVLMMRPSHLSAEARAEELRKSRGQIRAKETELGTAPAGHFERSDPRVAPRINKTIERMEVPDDSPSAA